MIAVLEWQPSQLWSRTLRELIIAYDAKLVSDWDHTSVIASFVHNLTAVVINAVHKSARARPKSPQDIHPYRRRIARGLKVSRRNFGVLWTVGNALCGGRRK